MNISHKWKFRFPLFFILFFSSSHRALATHPDDVQALRALAPLAMLPVGMFNFYINTVEVNDENENAVRITRGISNVLVDSLRIIDAACALYSHNDSGMYIIPWLCRDVQKLCQDLLSLGSSRKNFAAFKKTQQHDSLSYSAAVFALLELEGLLRLYLACDLFVKPEDKDTRLFLNSMISLMRLCQEALNAESNTAQKVLYGLIALHACYSIKEYFDYSREKVLPQENISKEVPVLQNIPIEPLNQPEVEDPKASENFVPDNHFWDNNIHVHDARPWPNHVRNAANNSNVPVQQPQRPVVANIAEQAARGSFSMFQDNGRNQRRDVNHDRYGQHYRYRDNNPASLQEALVDVAGEIAGEVAVHLVNHAAGRQNRSNERDDVPMFGYDDPIAQHLGPGPWADARDPLGFDRAHARAIRQQFDEAMRPR